MGTFLIALSSFVGFVVAYHTYGRWLGSAIFQLDPDAPVPSRQLEDGVDFVPSRKSIVFGHHFTSIAGTGPIVGPAIAVFWGWLPALLWVVFGSIFIGAVHDFGALVVSLRNRGQTVGEIAGRMISPRAKSLFLLSLFFALTIVLAIFGLVIASIFKLYPESVLPVWVSLPLAIIVGLLVRRGKMPLLPLSLGALVIVYASVWAGVYYLPIRLDALFGVSNPTLVWTIILLVYCAIASVLPVWLLLQPRDYINSHQLMVALILLVAGMVVASLSGRVDLFAAAPAWVPSDKLPDGTPPIVPFLFITIACGAISGFHCLVSSGTSSKQIACETDAQIIGYGSMLLEAALAVVVILACCAGVGMGKFDVTTGQAVLGESAQPLVGRAAWNQFYNPGAAWGEFGFDKKVGAFVEGGANFLTALGLSLRISVGVIAVLVACFAATTLDTATRLQRYVIQEIGESVSIPALKNRYVATGLAVFCGGAIAFLPNKPFAEGGVPGTGGLLLWPLFGATNQLLAGLAFMVSAFYLWRRNKPVWFLMLPMAIMIVLPAWALVWRLFNRATGWFWSFADYRLLATIGLITLALQAWMVIEALLAWPRAKGVLETVLPPLDAASVPSSVDASPATAPVDG